MERRKILILTILGCVVFLLILLAGGIDNILLRSGKALPFYLPRGAGRIGGGGDDSSVLITIIRGFLALMMVITLIYIVVSLFTKEGRRRILAAAFSIALIFGLILFMQQIVPLMKFDSGPTPTIQSEQSHSNLNVTIVPEELPAIPETTPPQWFSTLTTLILALMLAGVAYGIFWLVRHTLAARSTPLDRLGQEALDAVNRLNAGEDVRETVIRCYLEMNRIVREERGVFREDEETPREFIQILVAEGLPLEPVKELTRIFEMVRYGNVKVSKEQEMQAISCLTEIAECCKSLGAKQ